MNRNFYEATRIIDVVNGATNFSQIVGDNFARLGLTQAQATTFTGLATTLQSAYETAERPETRTPVAIEQRRVAQQAMKENAVLLAKIIVATPGVTNDQLVALGLLPRRSRSVVPAPTDRPGVSVDSVIGRTVSIRLTNPATPSRRAKPRGTQAAWVYSYVGEEYPADPGLWNFEGASSRANFEITFPNTLAGGTQVWICAAWVNAKQETGPASMPVTTYLQGGGAAGAEELKIAA